MSKSLLHYNPITGVEHYVHENPDDHRLIVETKYDRAPILEHTAYMRNEVAQSSKTGPVKIGSIPTTLYFEWLYSGMLGELDENMQPVNIDPEKIRVLLNSYEYSKLKTIDGQA